MSNYLKSKAKAVNMGIVVDMVSTAVCVFLVLRIGADLALITLAN